MGTSSVDWYRREQALLTAALTRDLVRLLRSMFDPVNPGASWRDVRQLVAALVVANRTRSADLGAAFYQRARTAAGLGAFVLPNPAPLPEEQILRTIDATGIATYQRALRSGATDSQAIDRTAVTLSGSASRLVLDGGRSVVDLASQADSEAVGWVRVTDASPCPWCLMLASRGSVYRSEARAGGERNSRFIGDGNFKWHDHCGCVAAPVFSHDDPNLKRADDLYDEWSSVTNGHSGQDAVNVWRQALESRNKQT